MLQICGYAFLFCSVISWQIFSFVCYCCSGCKLWNLFVCCCFFFHFKVVRFLRRVFLIRLCPTRGNGKLMRMAIGQPLNHCCARLKRHRPGIQIPRTEPQPRRQLASNLRNPATNQEQTIKIAQTEHWHVPSILNSRTKCTVQAILNIQHGYLNPFRKWY